MELDTESEGDFFKALSSETITASKDSILTKIDAWLQLLTLHKPLRSKNNA